jgi:hypothetical protein
MKPARTCCVLVLALLCFAPASFAQAGFNPVNPGTSGSQGNSAQTGSFAPAPSGSSNANTGAGGGPNAQGGGGGGAASGKDTIKEFLSGKQRTRAEEALDNLQKAAEDASAK